jgi:carboxypeptidase Taq
LARGDFTSLLEWLGIKVYRHGSRFRPRDLMLHATGAAPDHRPLVEGLKAKYGEIYGL